MKLKIALLPGDGVGPEVTAQAVKALRTVADIGGLDFHFREYPVGGAAIKASGSPLPPATLDACLESDAVLLGAVGAREYDSLPPASRPEAGLLVLRKALGGFANLRPAISHRSIADCSPLQPQIIAGADILVVRELLGGLYFGEPRGFETDNDESPSAALNTMRYSRSEIERVARIAFDQATQRRRKVTSVDKANVLETSQLWRQVVNEVAKDYPNVELEHLYVDACAMHLMMTPRRFDVILTENLFGDILSDEAAVITGSLGMLPSATIGGDVDLYEPVHGSAPDIAGRNQANPIGAIFSAAMLLRHTAGLDAEATEIERAVWDVLKDGHRTLDLKPTGKTLSTTEMGAFVESALADRISRGLAYHAV
ncbi:MAG: 3-isopropylmalate dehydrogenase [Terriglobales bacterium]|jgi:3-isopropylmalate dehydrogenase